MSDLSEIVSLTISTDTLGIARAGFGTPMILSCNATFPERIRFYGDIPGVAADFAIDSPEYLAATAMFSQSPHPNLIAIGRAVGKPTQSYTVTVSTVANTHIYSLKVAGQGFVATTVTFTSDSTATNDEIAAGLVAALNGVASKNYLAATAGSAGSLTVVVTASAPGNWFSVESVEVAYLKIAQTHAAPTSPSLANDLDAIQLENSDWYGIISLYNSDAVIKAVAAWVQPQVKIYVAATSDSETVTLATGNNDTADALHVLGYNRTMVAYHPSPIAFFGAAWMGRMLPLDPGSDNWKFKTLAGVPAVKTTATHRVNIRAKKANTYTTVAGRNITWEGTVSNGDFVDNTRGIDWLEDDLAKGVFGAMAGIDKVPFTDAGIALLQNEIHASLDRAIERGIIAADPKPIILVPRAADVTSSNKALRLLPDVKFSAILAGSINKIAIQGTISV